MHLRRGSLTLSPTSQTLYTGEATQTITVTLVCSGGFDRTVTLSCSQLPANTTCAANPATIADANGVSQLVIQTAAPIQVSATASASNSTWPKAAGTALAAFALIFIPFRRRSSRRRRILSVLVLGAVFVVMSGCGAPDDSGGTPPGVYNISVDATYSGYGATLTHSAPFTLTVHSLF